MTNGVRLDLDDGQDAAAIWARRREALWHALVCAQAAEYPDGLLTTAVEAVMRRMIQAAADPRGARLHIIERAMAGRPIAGLAPVIRRGAGGTRTSWWEFGDEGDPVLPVLAVITWPVVPDGVPVCEDLLALTSGEPARWWRQTGAIDVLGEGHARAAIDAAFDDEAEQGARTLRLMRDPWTWASADGPAACVLDWQAPLARTLLTTPRLRLVCDDVAHGEALQRRIREARPALPEVMVVDPAAAEAA